MGFRENKENTAAGRKRYAPKDCHPEQLEKIKDFHKESKDLRIYELLSSKSVRRSFDALTLAQDDSFFVARFYEGRIEPCVALLPAMTLFRRNYYGRI